VEIHSRTLAATPPEPDPKRPGRGAVTPRDEVYQEIERGGPLTISQIAQRTRLHVNTVRDHLNTLYQDGRIHFDHKKAPGRGRPAQIWSVADPKTRTPYAGLAAALASALAESGSNASRLAREAGRAWGESVAQDRTEKRINNLDLEQEICEVLREQGFAPEARDEHSYTLGRCPLRAVAGVQPDIVCAVHAGMIEGLASARQAPGQAELLPLVEPCTCMLRFRRAHD
jgi:predicted ArsR family transcriptional regulator